MGRSGPWPVFLAKSWGGLSSTSFEAETGVCHAAGRSYGDCALHTGGALHRVSSPARILGFDAATGVLDAQAGVNFRQVLDAFLPRGWIVPVSPGTGFATLGGAVANDVHGKNHAQDGSFTQHVIGLTLVPPDGTPRALAPGDAAFAATAGGVGLTGTITRVQLRMRRVPGPGLRMVERRAGDFDALIAGLAAVSAAPYAVAWVDAAAGGAAFGRGVVQAGYPCASDGGAGDGGAAGLGEAAGRGRAVRVPFDAPAWVLSPAVVRAFNAVTWRRVPAAGRERVVSYAQFLHPLDAILDWNRLYGRRGLIQFQCVLPEPEAADGIRAILAVAAGSGRASPLAVLKRLGTGSAGMLSFPMAGLTLALDFARAPGIEALYDRLTGMVIARRGRVYLAKDALMTAAQFRAMYAQWPAWWEVVRTLDPGAVLQSDMSRRLRMHEEG